MKLKDQLYFVKENMKKNKLRLFMTILATAMGTAFLIVLASVGFGLHNTLIKDVIEQETLNQIDIYGKDDPNDSGITPADIETIASLEGLRAVRTLTYMRQEPTFVIDDFYTEALVTVVDFDEEEKANQGLTEGNFPQDTDEIIIGSDFKSQLIEVGQDIAQLYNEEGDALDLETYEGTLVGKTIEVTLNKSVVDELTDEEIIEQKTFTLTISGEKEAPKPDFRTDTRVYISYELFEAFTDFTGSMYGESIPYDEYVSETFLYDSVTLHATNLNEIEALTDQLADLGYYHYSVATELNQINMLFGIFKAGLIFIGTIAVIIASIGIFNTMTMAVTERSGEIGIMKAIGAHPKTIKQLFLLESSMIGFAGAIVGILVSLLIKSVVNIGLPLILESIFEDSLPTGFRFSEMPLSLILIALSICMIVTLISGIRPAKKATQVDVLTALKREI